MGRGRAKAKQTKVARELKYGGPNTDLSRLQAELAGDSGSIPVFEDELEDDPYDPYAKYLEDEPEENEDEPAR